MFGPPAVFQQLRERPGTQLRTEDAVVHDFLVNYTAPFDARQTHTYESVEGRYGHYPKVILKRAHKGKKNDKGKTFMEIGINDLKHMQLLSGSDHMARSTRLFAPTG